MEGSSSQAGFYYQNNVAALKIIECLFFNTDITHVRLENYEKGNHIDDIIVYRKNKIEYYQVKWTQDGENSYTLFNLLTPQGPKKSIFRQLAEGYLSAKQKDVDFSITLFTTKRESPQKRPSEGVNHSLTEIRTNIFEPLKNSSEPFNNLSNYAEYFDTLEIIRNECSLDEESFNNFLKKLEFKFSQEPTPQIQNAIKIRLDRIGIETPLLEKLLDGVVNWSITGEQITKDTVLKQLGITDRFEDKLSHYFKTINEKYYVPNVDLNNKLSTSLSELEGGYIFLEGLPGIGKSTALTKFKEENPEVTFTFYCFIPDEKNTFGELRHKSYYFLKSLCISIENQFPDVDLPHKYSERFEEKFSLYIDKLVTLNRKIVFIIDGLDHVHRDTSLGENSLLHQIKGNLPKGIFFILSSQYRAVLTQSVAEQVDSDSRRYIVVPRFTQQEISQYLINKGVDPEGFIDQIERVSSGIPLYLHYISELLLKTKRRNYEQILNNLPNLIDGKINSYHEYLFKMIENDEFEKWVLAVFAYRKENSSPETVQKILKLAGENKSVTDVSNVIKKYSHLLKQINGRDYSIFHNSFREFVLSKTESLKDTFNKALVLFYEQSPYTDEAYRNYLKHLSEIEEYRKIISFMTLEWVKFAWFHYRSLEEIKDNIDIALNACIEDLSLSEYIRISFIKAQVARLCWNFETSEIDMPILLLNGGETANSLRSIWDGDFVLSSKDYFCNYLNYYYLKTGTLLPQNIIQQGFSKNLSESDVEKITNVYKAKTLAGEPIQEIFDKIDEIKWKDKRYNGTDYLKDNLSEGKNIKINLGIKSKIIDFLYQCKKYEQLNDLLKIFESEKALFSKAQIALIKLLLPTEKLSALTIVKQIEFSKLSVRDYLELVAFSSDYLTNKELLQYFPKRNINPPTLRNQVINKEDTSYKFYKDIIELFNYLKPIWIYEPELVDTFLLRVPSLSDPSKSIYSSILYLSELWNKNRILKLTEEAKTDLAKKSIAELYIPRHKEYRKTHYSLFDGDNDGNFIAVNLHHIFNNIFHFLCKIFSDERINELVQYWLRLEEGEHGYRDYRIGLSIAKEINSSQHKNCKESIHKIIKHSEEIARYEEETSSLLDYIAEVAETYGICGFNDDFRRNYNQLVEIAFGLNYKKDYQSSYIIFPLRLVHEREPEKTLEKLSDVFNIQNQLADVGRSRMHHICLSELISFTLEIYPELALQLLEREDKNLGREEAIGIILEPVIKKANKENLTLILSIIKTLPRWESIGDNHFLVLSLQLLKRAIQLDDNAFISRLLEVVKQNVLVELENSQELEKFSEVLIELGRDYTEYSLPKPQKKIENDDKVSKLTKDERFLIRFSTPSIIELIQLFEKDYSEFDKLIQSNYEICLQNRRILILRSEYHRSKSIFQKFYESLPEVVRLRNQPNLRQVIRNYISFSQKIVDYKKSSFLSSSELTIFLNQFVDETNSLFPNNIFKHFIETEFEEDKWIENILQFINESHEYVFNDVIPEGNVYKLVENVSVVNIDNLIDFVNKWTVGKVNSICSLKLAYRLTSIDPVKAKNILIKVSQDESENFLFPRNEDSSKIGFDILKTLIKVDEEFGKKFLLKSYSSHMGRYGDNLITSLDKLLKYQDYFNDNKVSDIYYESNLQYNKELAKGLPEKENEYLFIKEHRETLSLAESVIKYLVGLFNYPVVKVRELTLQSVFDLVIENPEYLKILIGFGLENGTDNQIEYTLVVLQAISLNKPKMLLSFKKELISLTNKEHFNILESVKELLLRLKDYDCSFLSNDELEIIAKLNTRSLIQYNNRIINTRKGKKFIYSTFQTTLLKDLYDNENDETEIQDDIYSDLMSKGWGAYNIEKESSIHRDYNINTNFDTIEIQSPYVDETKSSINRIFHSKIKRGCFEDKFLDEIKTKFRLYDSSKLLFKIMVKPTYINWLPEDITEQDFINFNDFKLLSENFVKREKDYLTLVEFGSQRPCDKFDEIQSTCYFKIFAFLKMMGFDDSIFDKDKRKLSVILPQENLYMYEFPNEQSSSVSFPIQEIKPIIEVSYNNFRGESDLINSNLLLDFFGNLGIEKVNLSEIILRKLDYPIEAIRWQSAYTSGTGRRRYKPTSEGFTLKIRRDILSDYLSKNNMSLCYDISIRRSVTKYKPESYMEWYELNRKITI